MEAERLVEPFSILEIKSSVWECDGDKALGPDGFNFKFLKRCWVGLEADFVAFFNKFHLGGGLNPGCTASFIALIPKVKDPMGFSDFRPISLVGCINKVLSKVLVNQLKEVIGKLVSPEQSAFLSGRSILDGPLMLNEIVRWLRKSNTKEMLFKVDIDKAYDSISWGFLDSVPVLVNLWKVEKKLQKLKNR
ncbi:uncharacterized protein LOC118485768 [Helianthus annuus]|uniref:uncharacterized protein LOC118485768 n=1 Tax=Helianthus annuus TaxID=4232 RepID=UPI0016533905|nr:uncharacterized protein LOC118485768 [Helianthus annuus]